MNKIKLGLGRLGIIAGEDKRQLENYVHPMYFRQRKSYDEYYIDTNSVDIELDINDLHILAETFEVTVTRNIVVLDTL